MAEGLEVFAFDLDGNGWESTTRYAPASARGAVTAAVREAGRDRQELPLHLLGHSVGGALVLDALARGEVEAVSAVAISTPLRVRLTSRILLAELAGF
ncbi:MAG: alpha/beta fold hydrolase, partial [Gemmatimonadota bacterium]|nr:alpha/beta fold hydrolase [Gemmatimonadota bacterium]